jgi:ABC-type transport system involved in multi-copper enzyme maturation permease subunit
MYVMIIVYLLWLMTAGVPLNSYLDVLTARTLSTRKLSEFMALSSSVFMAMQMLAVFLLAPAYTSGAVAAERERGTLVPLLATDLRGREVVLSMLLSRMANLGLVLLTGLPILAMLQFVGGVDPDVVLAGAVASAITMVSLGSLGILVSIRSQKPWTALLVSYCLIAGYLAVGLAARQFLAARMVQTMAFVPMGGIPGQPGSRTVLIPVTGPAPAPWQSVKDGMDWINAGNVLAVGMDLLEGVERGSPLAALLWRALHQYVIFHSLLALVCLTLALMAFRSGVLSPAEGKGAAGKGAKKQEAAGRAWRFTWLLRAWPLGWKELVVAPSSRARRRFGWLIGLLFVLAVLFPVIYDASQTGDPLVDLYYYFFLAPYSGGFWSWRVRNLAAASNDWLCVASVVIGSLMLLQVGVRAAGSMTGERSRGTLDALLTSSISPRSILFAKWFGSVAAPRRTARLLAALWLMILLVGGVYARDLAAWVGCWLVYAGFMAWLGLYASTLCDTTQRAIMWTVITSVVLIPISWLLAFDCGEWYGIVPLITLYWLPSASIGGATQLNQRPNLSMPMSVMVGLGLTVLAQAYLWLMANRRFNATIGRPQRPKEAAV